MPVRPILILAAAATLSACGLSGPAYNDPPPGVDATVGMDFVRFDPETITIRAGQTVQWRNTSPIPHTVTADDGAFAAELDDLAGTTPLNDLNDIALKIRSGDVHAFEQVFRMYYKGMCGYAKKYLSDIDEAEEIVQEVFSSYCHKKEILEITGSLEAYLYRAVRNRALNALRDQKPQAALDVAEAVPDETEPGSDLQYRELLKKYREAVRELPERRRQVFTLNRLHGLAYEEVAEALVLQRREQHVVVLALADVGHHGGEDAAGSPRVLRGGRRLPRL